MACSFLILFSVSLAVGDRGAIDFAPLAKPSTVDAIFDLSTALESRDIARVLSWLRKEQLPQMPEQNE